MVFSSPLPALMASGLFRSRSSDSDCKKSRRVDSAESSIPSFSVEFASSVLRKCFQSQKLIEKKGEKNEYH